MTSEDKATMVLNPVISKISSKLVVLASASPRRREILSNAGLRFEVVPSWFKETLDKALFKAPHEYAVETAKQKALEVARRMPLKHRKTPDIVIGADTIVTVDGMILEKPVDKHDAYRMLSSLSGKEHSVFTGVAIVVCHEKKNEGVDYQLIDFYEETKVKFAQLSESLLWEYINSGEPMDKAGGYGIQSLGGMLVEYVHGDFLNVVGFPLNHFCKQLDTLYNRSFSSDQESPSVCHNGDDGDTILAQHPPPNLPAQSSPTPSSSTNHNPSSSHTQISPSSPDFMVKRNRSHSEVGERLSAHAVDKAKRRHSESPAVPSLTSRGQMKTGHLQRIVELMDGFKASKALFTACEMCVFDLLQSSPGLDAAQVAQEIKASVKGTECLLEACVSLGLLKSKERKCQKPAYKNTDLAKRFLLSDAPFSLLGYIRHCNNKVWPLSPILRVLCRREQTSTIRRSARNLRICFRDSVYNSQEDTLRFMNAMHSIAKVTGKAVATAFDLSSFKTACDIGGCTGAMAHEFTKAHPGLSVTVFDLPAVVKMSDHFHPPHTDDRVSFVAGDFFEDEFPKADLYILARILHDWPDEKVHILLSRIAAACTPGCAVLIAETMLDGHASYSALQSLNMLTQTEGMERTESQYADLLSRHGFGDTRVFHTKNFLDAFIAVKM